MTVLTVLTVVTVGTLVTVVTVVTEGIVVTVMANSKKNDETFF